MTKKLSAGNKNLKFVIFQAEQEGVEIKIFQGDRPNRIGASKINPIERLRDEEKITHQEFCAAKKYQINFNLSNKDGYSKPSLIYDGLPDSARSTKQSENTPSQNQIDASRYIFKVKMILQSHNLVNKFHQGKFRIVDMKLFGILEEIFEKGRTTKKTEATLGLNHKTIEERVKFICGVLSDVF